MEYNSENMAYSNHYVGFSGLFVKIVVLHSASGVVDMNVLVLMHELYGVEAHGQIIPSLRYDLGLRR